SRPLRALAEAAAEHEARSDLPVADLGPERGGFRPVDGHGPDLHRHVVAAARPKDPAQDGARGTQRERGEVTGAKAPVIPSEARQPTTTGRPPAVGNAGRSPRVHPGLVRGRRPYGSEGIGAPSPARPARRAPG